MTVTAKDTTEQRYGSRRCLLWTEGFLSREFVSVWTAEDPDVEDSLMAGAMNEWKEALPRSFAFII